MGLNVSVLSIQKLGGSHLSVHHHSMRECYNLSKATLINYYLKIFFNPQVVHHTVVVKSMTTTLDSQTIRTNRKSLFRMEPIIQMSHMVTK